MTATIRSRSSAAVTGPIAGGVIALTKPAGAVATDRLVVKQWQTSDSLAASMTAPAGWTQVGTTGVQDAAGVGMRGKIWERTLDGTEGASFNFGFDSAASVDGGGLDCECWQNGTFATGAAFWNAGPTWGGSTSTLTAQDAPSISPTVADTRLVCAAAEHAFNNLNTYSPPAGMTERLDLEASGNYISITAADEVRAASGATGVRTFTATRAAAHLTVSYAVAPGGNAAPTANAGPDQANVEPWSTVTLSGSDSDSDGTVASRAWAQTAGAPTVRLLPPADLADAFATADAAKFSYGGLANVSGKQLHLPVPAGVNDWATAVTSVPALPTLVGREASLRVVKDPVGVSQMFYLGLIEVGSSPTDGLYLWVSGGTISAVTRLAGVDVHRGDAAYDPVAHQRRRVRESGGNIIWEVSQDGLTWTNLASWAHAGSGLNLAALEATLGVGKWDVEASSEAVIAEFRYGLVAASTASVTFEAPGTLAGTTLTFQYTATDNLGASTSDTMTVAVLPAAERIMVGGSWVPCRTVNV